MALQGGSAGGAGADPWGSPYFFGGQGGGALELGAVDTIAIRGPGIYADGEHGAPYPPPEICLADFYESFGGGGGGSGGGILVHADSVTLETRLSARGGYGGRDCGGAAGGGGGGGRIAVIVGSGGFLNTGAIVVAGGPWGGQAGQIVLPQPRPPTSAFSSSCQFLVCTFTDASTPGTVAIASVSWNFGDGSQTGTGSPATHTFSTAGSYTVTLTVTDLNGLVASSSKAVVVAAPLPPTAALTVSCTNLRCDFADASTAGSGAIALRSWSFGDGTPAVNAMAGTNSRAPAREGKSKDGGPLNLLPFRSTHGQLGARQHLARTAGGARRQLQSI